MYGVISHYNGLSIDQKRNVLTWRPVVVQILHFLTDLDEERFVAMLGLFYHLILNLFLSEMASELQNALFTVFERIGAIYIEGRELHQDEETHQKEKVERIEEEKEKKRAEEGGEGEEKVKGEWEEEEHLKEEGINQPSNSEKATEVKGEALVDERLESVAELNYTTAHDSMATI